MLDSSHWLAGKGPAGQHSHWSSDASRWGTLTPEVYNFRGGFDVCMVGEEEIPAKQGSSQSCDKEHVAVEFVVNLHCLSYLAEYFDVVSVYCEDLHRGVGRVLHDALLLVG